MLSKKDLTTFHSISQSHFGSSLSDEEAIASAIQLINLMRVVYEGKVDEALTYFKNKKQQYA